MNLRRMALLCAAGAAAMLFACARPEKAIGPRLPVKITILGINDFHGALEERSVQLQTSGGTTATVRVGGGALLASYLAKLEEQNSRGTVLLSAGDMWQGSLESNYFEGRPVVLLDNFIGVDAAALGNHEFDYGPVGVVSLADPKNQPPAQRYGALEARRAEMKFPLLAANVRATEPGAPVFEPFVILDRKGVKIGIVGLATEDTPNVTQRPNVEGLAFDPPAEALVKASKEAREKGAEIVIGVGHLGGACKRGTPPEEEGACEEAQEVTRVLRALPAGTIDAFVAGHTHQYMAHYVAGIPVIESGAYGAAIGRIELLLDPETHKVTKSTIAPPLNVCRDVLADTGDCTAKGAATARPEVVPASLNQGPIEPSAEMWRLLAPFRQEVAEMKAEVLADVERPMAVKRYEPSDVGALVTDEMLAATRRYADVPDARVAIQNSGGIRKEIAKGPLTYGGLYEVLPFDNLLTTMTLTTEQLERLLGDVVKGGRIFQTSGLLVEVRCDKTGAAESVRVSDWATGKPLPPKEKQVIVFNDFLANGGDGTKGALEGVEITFHPQYLLRDVLAEGLKARKSAVNSTKEPALDPKKPRLKLAAGCKDPRSAANQH